MILCEHVHRKFLLHIRRRRHHRHCSDPGSHHFRQPVRSAHMSGEKRDHKLSRLIHTDYRRILELIPHIWCNGAHRDPAGTHKNKSIVPQKSLLRPLRKSALRHCLIRHSGIRRRKLERVPPGDPQRLVQSVPAAWSVLLLRTLIVLFRADLIRQSFRSSGKGVIDPLHRLKSVSRKTNKRYIHNLSPSEI